VSAGVGPSPRIPAPNTSLIPVVNVVKAKGWPDGRGPVGAEGTTVTAFARDLHHPRWLYVLPNGDVLVAETNAPKRPDDNKGIKGWFFKHYQKKAGGTVPSPNRITLLRDADGDGIAETRMVLLANLNAPFGMALVGQDLYVANTDAVVRFPYTPGALTIKAPGVKVVDLPAGTINHHWTKNPSRAPMARCCTSPSGRTATRRRTASARRTGARPSGRSIRRPAAIAYSRAGCVTRSGWRGSRRAARCGSP